MFHYYYYYCIYYYYLLLLLIIIIKQIIFFYNIFLPLSFYLLSLLFSFFDWAVNTSLSGTASLLRCFTRYTIYERRGRLRVGIFTFYPLQVAPILRTGEREHMSRRRPKSSSGSRAGNNRKKDVSNSKGRDAEEKRRRMQVKEKQAFDMESHAGRTETS